LSGNEIKNRAFNTYGRNKKYMSNLAAKHPRKNT
jgi:hypothetical protein